MKKNHLGKQRMLLLLDIFLLFFAFCYYTFFANKGLVLSDEGYYVHYAERILHGEMPYKDFILQYTPGYFYLLAFLYKIFGAQILVGRFLSLFFCIAILLSLFVLLKIYKIYHWKWHLMIGGLFIFLSYPLLHIPLVIWPSVLFAILTQIVYLYWYRNKKIKYIFILGILLALTVFFRQTIGAILILLVNSFIIFSDTRSYKEKAMSTVYLNLTWLFFTTLWMYIFFIKTENIQGLLTLYNYNKQFVSTFPFSYPPLSYLLQTTGFFKLLPYYYPVVFALYIIYEIFKKRFNWEKGSFAVMTLFGFAFTVYPASDLLHVYPFLGVVVIASLVYSHKKKFIHVLLVLACVLILLGIYLTFFTRSYRYEGYFLQQTTPLELPKTKGILIDPYDPTTKYISDVYTYITKNTKPNDYIFVYPFSPMYYFLLDRQNPHGIVQYILLEAPENIYSEARVLDELKKKNVRYIITAGAYKFNKKVSQFIQKQQIVHTAGPFIIFKLTKH